MQTIPDRPGQESVSGHLTELNEIATSAPVVCEVVSVHRRDVV
jgi:hypothetical protein